MGSAAVENANALGINPSALAATCVIESGCQNVAGSGTVAGAFQMTASTYTAMINAAVAQNPSLASQIVPGLAGRWIPQLSQLPRPNIYSRERNTFRPTVSRIRLFWTFAATTTSAQLVEPQSLMHLPMRLWHPCCKTILRNPCKNGVTPGETVAQWQASVSAKIGNAATQSVNA